MTLDRWQPGSTSWRRSGARSRRDCLHAARDEVLTLHPRTAERYKQRVAEIHAALSKGDEAAREAVELVRELIDRIVVTPTDEGEPMKLELVGNVAALLEEHPPNGGAIVAVAGPRNHLCRTR